MVYASLARRRVVRKAPQREAGAVAAVAVHPCTRLPDAPARRERGSRLAEAVEVLPLWSSVSVGRDAAVGLRPVFPRRAGGRLSADAYVEVSQCGNSTVGVCAGAQTPRRRWLR